MRVREVVSNTALATPARWALRGFRKLRARAEVSADHEVIEREEISKSLTLGWQDPSIPGRQRELVDTELAATRRGEPPKVYSVAAEAVRATGLHDPSILEIGCASGYYSEALQLLLGKSLDYMGLDYSAALIQEASRHYPGHSFVVGDATKLPFSNSTMDVVFSPAVIMHVLEYGSAIAESFRVADRFCIFHRTPVSDMDKSVFMTKKAYGVEVLEVVFSENELLEMFKQHGQVVGSWMIDQYHLPAVPGTIEMKTYLCRKD